MDQEHPLLDFGRELGQFLDGRVHSAGKELAVVENRLETEYPVQAQNHVGIVPGVA